MHPKLLNLILPFPDNPQHADNLTSVKIMELQGFEGPDADLTISLDEYGMAWRLMPDGKEWLVVYNVTTHSDKRRRWNRSTFDAKLDFKKEFDWIQGEEWDTFLDSLGTSWEEWEELPVPLRLHDLARHYGIDNVFGSTHWEGFRIAGLEQNTKTVWYLSGNDDSGMNTRVFSTEADLHLAIAKLMLYKDFDPDSIEEGEDLRDVFSRFTKENEHRLSYYDYGETEIE